VLGAAVDRADGWEAARKLAEALNVPVWAPPETERAAFPEDHALFQGFLPFAIAPLSEQFEGHDLVFVVGAPVFRYYPYVPGEYLPEGASLLHITDDPAEAARAPVGDSLLSDARLALEGLLNLVRPSPYPPVPARILKRDRSNPPGPVLEPADVFATLQANRPDDAVLLIESTSNISEFHEWVPTTRPRSFSLFASGGLPIRLRRPGLSASGGGGLRARGAGQRAEPAGPGHPGRWRDQLLHPGALHGGPA